MRTYKLNETVLKITGNAVNFLNGLTSNVVEAPLNAFLNQHGRIIATFRKLKITDEEGLIVVPTIALESLLKHLERYAKISRVQLVPLADKVYMDLDTKEVITETQERPNSISEEEFTLFRLENDMPLMGIDYQADEFILNVHEHHYTSYTKGCFLGQEPVAKVHNRSHPSKKLVANKETKSFVFLSNKPS